MILIILSILLAITAALGFVIGRMRRDHEAYAAYMRRLEEDERRIAVNSAFVHAIAQDYETGAPRKRPHRELPDGWRII